MYTYAGANTFATTESATYRRFEEGKLHLNRDYTPFWNRSEFIFRSLLYYL